MRKVSGIRLKNSNGDYFCVEIISRELFREKVSEIIPDDTGIPSYCYLENDTYYFDYKAQEQYTVYYDGYKYPAEISAPGDSPEITGIDDVIVAQATGYIFASLKQFEAAQFWFVVAADKIRQKIDETRISEVGHLESW
jgi:hypothetical protein